MKRLIGHGFFIKIRLCDYIDTKVKNYGTIIQ